MAEFVPASRYFDAAEAFEQHPIVQAVDVVLDRPDLDTVCLELSLPADIARVPPSVLRTIADRDLGLDTDRSGTRPGEHVVVVV